MRQGVIAAISTPPGKGGVAIIRISGTGAFEIIDRIFSPMGRLPLSERPARTQVYGYIIYNEEKIDDVMVTRFPAPHSYTGEDVVEISCHGGILVTRTVLEAVLQAGAIPADAGEFTRRAFINGRLTLTETEAIGSLLEAQSREQMRLSSLPSRTRLRERIEEIRAALTTVLGSVYARIDYPEEDLGELTDEATVAELVRILDSLDTLISTYRTGRAITEGISAVICGKPNAGKSTLYNLLVGEDAAIVTDIPGTTTDILERSVPLGRVMLRLYDTAGIRGGEGVGRVEKIGIERTLDRLCTAELIIAVFDLSRPFDSGDRETLDAVGKASGAKICILNKADTDRRMLCREELPDIFDEYIEASATEGEAAVVSELSRAVERMFTDEKITVSAQAIVSSARQHAALTRTRELVNSAILAYRDGMPADAASSDIEMALGAIGELDGRAVSESVVSDIFSRFCVGK